VGELFTGWDIKREAHISACGRYRYSLSRTWLPARPPLVVVMLNPSVADAERDDATIRRLIGFARREVAGGLVVVNLFAFRATDPAELWREHAAGFDVVGPENDEAIRRAVETIGPTSAPESAWAHDPGPGDVVVAWGADPRADERARVVSRMLRGWCRAALCLGTTKGGRPCHPLRLSNATRLQPWRLG
jgi:hypothetical protein